MIQPPLRLALSFAPAGTHAAPLAAAPPARETPDVQSLCRHIKP